MVLYQLIPSGNGVALSSALVIGFIEETAKLLIIGYFINSFRVNYIFNGMLIGACVALCGFETSGYTGEFGLVTLFVRSWQAIGTHTIWSAIIGAAIILAKGRHKPVKGETIVRPKFLQVLHPGNLLCMPAGIGNRQYPFSGLWYSKMADYCGRAGLPFSFDRCREREVRTLQGQHIIN